MGRVDGDTMSPNAFQTSEGIFALDSPQALGVLHRECERLHQECKRLRDANQRLTEEAEQLAQRLRAESSKGIAGLNNMSERLRRERDEAMADRDAAVAVIRHLVSLI